MWSFLIIKLLTIKAFWYKIDKYGEKSSNYNIIANLSNPSDLFLPGFMY